MGFAGWPEIRYFLILIHYFLFVDLIAGLSTEVYFQLKVRNMLLPKKFGRNENECFFEM